MNRNRLLLLSLVVVGILVLVGGGGLLTWRLLFSAPSDEVAATTDPNGNSLAAGEIATNVEGSLNITDSVSIESNNGDASRGANLVTMPFVQAVNMAPVTLNPIFAVDQASLTIIDKLYPRLLGQDPNGGFIVPSGLAERWEISPDGRTYTFFLRAGLRWSDGQPITAHDFKFTYDALANPALQSPYRDRTVGIMSVEARDAQTLVITMTAPNCAVLHSLRHPILPSHRFAADFSDLATSPMNQTPTVSAGPFRFVDQVMGENVRLASNPDYWQGAPLIQNWEVRVMPNPEERRQALADGLIDLAYFDANELAATSMDAAIDVGSSAVVKYLSTDGYSFLAMNLSDPATPQAGRASDGSRMSQSSHPILGDLAVRQAIAAAIDYDRIIEQVYNGRAYRATSYVPSTVSWAYESNLPLPSYDPTAAAQMLTDAGWVDDNGDGVRSRGDQLLRLSIRTNEDNAKRVQIAQLIAEQLTALGIQVDLAIVNFDELASTLLDQRFDLVVIGWENLGADPGNSPFWNSQADIPGTGFNFTSFNDQEVDSWLESATRLPGCDLNGRSALYKQVQQRIAQQLPYVPLATEQSAWAYQNRWQGISPGPWEVDYNVTSWRLP